MKPTRKHVSLDLNKLVGFRQAKALSRNSNAKQTKAMIGSKLKAMIGVKAD